LYHQVSIGGACSSLPYKVWSTVGNVDTAEVLLSISQTGGVYMTMIWSWQIHCSCIIIRSMTWNLILSG